MKKSKIKVNIKYRIKRLPIIQQDTFTLDFVDAIPTTYVYNRSDCLKLVDAVIYYAYNILERLFIDDLLITCFMRSNDGTTPSYIQVYVPVIEEHDRYDIIEHGCLLRGNKRNKEFKKNLSNYTLEDYYRDYEVS